MLRTENTALRLNEDCILEHATVKSASCGATYSPSPIWATQARDWLEAEVKSTALCRCSTHERNSCNLKTSSGRAKSCEWHRSYHCGWTKGLPSHQMRVSAFLGPGGGTATSHQCSSALPALAALLKGGHRAETWLCSSIITCQGGSLMTDTDLQPLTSCLEGSQSPSRTSDQ